MQEVVYQLRGKLLLLLKQHENLRADNASLRERLRIAERSLQLLQGRTEQAAQAALDRQLAASLPEAERDALRDHLDGLVGEIDRILGSQIVSGDG